MKTRTILIVALLLALAQTIRAATAESWISQGRAALAATNLAAANTCFANALAVSPGHQTGNVFYAVTRLLVWPSQPVGRDFLNRLDVPSAGRDIYKWTALPPRDRNGVPCPPVGVTNASDFTAMLRTNILTELIGAESNLAKVTDPGFVLSLTSNETRTVAITLDYGDIKLLRAMLRAAEYCCYTAHSWDLQVAIVRLHCFYACDQSSVGRLLADYPHLMEFATTDDLTAAKAALVAGVNRYCEASEIIRNRPTNVVRLFNYDPEMADDEAKFRQTLADATNSLPHPVPLALDTNYIVFLGSQFSGMYSPRSFLPVIQDNRFGLGTLPDPTFGGLVNSTKPGIVEDSVEEFLAGALFPIPTIGPGASKVGPQFQFVINTLKHRGYVVEVSTNLQDWTTSYAFFSFAGGYAFTDANAYTLSRCFYRIVDRTEDMPPPANDNFANRIPLTGLGFETFGYNASATTEPGEPANPWNSVWWSWTATLSGLVVVKAESGSGWSYARVYTGSALNNLTRVTVVTGPPYYDGVAFNAVAGTTYQIQVEGDPGGIRLVITAPPILLMSPADGTAFPAPANITISGSAADIDGSIASLAIYADGELLGSTTQGWLTKVWSDVGAGPHWIEVEAVDNLGVTAWWDPTVYVRPLNDSFANRIPISGSTATVTGTTLGATKEPGEPNHAGDPGGSSVWWSWTSPFNGYITISADTATIWAPSNGLLGVYTGASVSTLAAVASGHSTNGGPAQVSFVAATGTTYQIAVDARYAVGLPITLRLIPTRPPVVSISSPTNGSVFSAPANIMVTANATDSDGTISRVDFYNWHNLIGSATTLPYTLPLSISSSGTQLSLSAKATDNLGTSTYSDEVSIWIGVPATTLYRSAPISNLSGPTAGNAYYKLSVPSGLYSLQIQIYGGTGDCDLYVAYGRQPTLYNYDYRPYLHGNNESVYIYNPTPGDWHIMLNGWAAYAGVTLSAQ